MTVPFVDFTGAVAGAASWLLASCGEVVFPNRSLFGCDVELPENGSFDSVWFWNRSLLVAGTGSEN
jgi:hypothetical protein